jgi:hypothetical protein
MKHLLIICALLASSSLVPAQNYVANLSEEQELVAGLMDPTFGLADFTLTGSTFSVTSSFYQVLGFPTGVTLNDAPPGTDGPVVFSFTLDSDSPDGSFSGSGTLTAGEITDLNAGDLCVNLSGEMPDGGIRGQIYEVPEPSELALPGAGLLAWPAQGGHGLTGHFAGPCIPKWWVGFPMKTCPHRASWFAGGSGLSALQHQRHGDPGASAPGWHRAAPLALAEAAGKWRESCITPRPAGQNPFQSRSDTHYKGWGTVLVPLFSVDEQPAQPPH